MIRSTYSTRMMARVAEDTKIANGTKRAAKKRVSTRSLGSVTYAGLTEIGGTKHALEVYCDTQANKTPYEYKGCHIEM